MTKLTTAPDLLEIPSFDQVLRNTCIYKAARFHRETTGAFDTLISVMWWMLVARVLRGGQSAAP